MGPSEVIAAAYQYFEGLGYRTPKGVPLLTDDPTLLFINSSIAPFKDLMIKGEDLARTFVVQNCFRNRYQHDGLFGFQMLGLLGNIQRSDEVQTEFLTFLIDVLKIKKERLHVVLEPSNVVLLNYWKSRFGEPQVHFCEGHPKYSTSWHFGAGSLLIGRGLTLAVESVNNHRCSAECDVFCSCNYYFPIGNVIAVESSAGNNGYIELGFGLEAILASLENGDYYSVHPYSVIVPGFVNRGFSLSESREMARCYVGGAILVEAGVKPANKVAGYVLKRLIRKIYEIILIKEQSFSQSEKLWQEFSVPPETHWGDYAGFGEMLAEGFPSYVRAIKAGLAQLSKITETRALESEESLINYYYGTFGIPQELIKQHLRARGVSRKG